MDIDSPLQDEAVLEHDSDEGKYFSNHYLNI